MSSNGLYPPWYQRLLWWALSKLPVQTVTNGRFLAEPSAPWWKKLALVAVEAALKALR